MNLQNIKSLFYKNSSEKILKLLFYNKNYKKSSFDINYELGLDCKKKDLNKNKNILQQKELIILGLNWKLVRASDIFSILKPFECSSGKINYVSILSYSIQQKKLCSEVRPQFNSFFDTQLSKKIGSEGKNVKFFARICCDSTNTLNNLYKKCNRIEIGNANEVLDMRFIKFDLLENITVIESVDKIPKNYFPTYLKPNSFSQKIIKLKPESPINQYKNLNTTVGINRKFFLTRIKSNKYYKTKKFYSPIFFAFSDNKSYTIGKNKIFQIEEKFLFGKFFLNLKI